MSISIDFYEIGRRIGSAIAAALSDAAREQVRASFAARYGLCRSCQDPLAGLSLEQICEECHAGEVLGMAMDNTGDGGEA